MVAALLAKGAVVAVRQVTRGIVRDHLVAGLGAPSRTATFSVPQLDLEVLKWNANENPEGVALYISVGASDTPVLGLANHRLEFYGGFLPELDHFAKTLAMIALDGNLNQSSLGHGQRLTYPEPLWPETPMHTVVVLRPKAEIVPPLIPDGSHVQFLQVVPIHSRELEYLRDHGVDALLSRCEADAVPFWDPQRSPPSSL